MTDFLRCRRAGSDGEGDEAGQDQHQRPAAGLRAHQLQGGTGLPQGHVVRGQLRLGQPQLHDVSLPPGESPGHGSSEGHECSKETTNTIR